MASDRGTEIRAEALRLFAGKGYDATSMRDIAKAVGLLPGSLYAHIQSKEQLLLEIIEQGIDDFLEKMTPVMAEPVPAPERLRRAITAHMEVIGRDLDRTGVVFHQWRSLRGADRGRVVAKRNAYEQLFVDLLDAGITAGDFRPDLDSRFAVLVILGALNWAPEWFSPTGTGSAEEIGQRVSDLLLHGLEVPARRQVGATIP